MSIDSIIGSGLSGMTRATQRVERAAGEIAQGSLDPKDVVELTLGQREFEANAAVLRTADEMLGTLLDRKA